MIILLSELQKDHLKLLHEHSTQVLIDFCKLAIDYLNNGVNHKKFSVGADKLQVSFVSIQNLVNALVYLLIEGCKHRISDPDFKSSLAVAGFSSEQQEVLTKLYNNKQKEISESLHLLQQRDPCYQDLNWRFEIQVASRNSYEQIKPTVSLGLVLKMSKPLGIVNINKDKIMFDKDRSKKPAILPVYINSNIQDAKAASHCLNIVQHVLLSCDLPNLLNMTNKLEEALKESKSQHVRKVQRALH